MTLPRPELKECPETPFYFYDETILRVLCEGFLASIGHDKNIVLHYAMKANSQPAILKVLRDYSFGVDVVSGGELLFAKNLSFASDHIAYSGVGKNEKELTFAIENEIGLIIVESLDEYKEILELAQKNPAKKVHIGFRFNPNLNVKTHPYIATGLWDHKFGIAHDEIIEMLELARPANVLLKGLSLHLGSQIFEDKVFYDALEEISKLAIEVKNKFNLSFHVLDVGGGLGVNYEKPFDAPDFATYGKFLKAAMKKWQELYPQVAVKIYSECGRALVAQAGFLVTRVLRIKKNPKKNFAIVDASMTELLRPALYRAFHAIEAITQQSSPKKSACETYDVVGPVCESADFLGEARVLPKLEKSDLLWVLCVGAYGYVMASTYNMRPLPAEWWRDKSGKLQSLRQKIEAWKL